MIILLKSDNLNNIFEVVNDLDMNDVPNLIEQQEHKERITLSCVRSFYKKGFIRIYHNMNTWLYIIDCNNFDYNMRVKSAIREYKLSKLKI